MTDNSELFRDVHWLMDILEHIDVGLIVMNRDYDIVLWNAFMQNHSALHAREVMGKDLFSIFPELPENWFKRKTQSVFKIHNAAFTTWEQRPYLFKFKHYRPITGTAEFMYQNSTIIPLLDTKGQVEHLCLIIYDVTDTAINKIGQKKANEQLRKVSQTDPLTQLNNRGYWEKCLIDAFKRYQRYQTTCSLIMLDIDHFKKVNDNYGHTVGDEVIRMVSREIRQQIRDLDIAGRYGGEEFGIILTNTELEAAELVAERIRKAVAGLQIDIDGSPLTFTISLGVCGLKTELNSHVAWLESCDQALYSSKDKGRNCVSVAS